MSALTWDNVGENRYETGTDRGVLYPYNSKTNAYDTGVAWSGLTKVSEAPDGAEETALYADNIKYGSMTSAENFKGSISAYMSPKEFDILDGTAEIAKGIRIAQQDRGTFGFSWRTLIGNDTKGTAFGYKIHLMYGAKVSPSQRENATVNESPATTDLSWSFTTTPIQVKGFKPTAHIIIDSTTTDQTALKKIEDMIYGTSTTAKLPTPTELVALVGTSTAV